MVVRYVIFIRLPPWAALSEKGRNDDHVILADHCGRFDSETCHMVVIAVPDEHMTTFGTEIGHGSR